MQSNTIGWTKFYDKASTDFSIAFQTEISNQLMIQFDRMMRIENFAENNELSLSIGLTDMKTMHQNGYTFALVEITTPPQYSKILTAFWKSDNPDITTSSEIVSEDLQIGWCSDFEKDYFLRVAGRKIADEIHKNVLGFTYIANFMTYPNFVHSNLFQLISIDRTIAWNNSRVSEKYYRRICFRSI